MNCSLSPRGSSPKIVFVVDFPAIKKMQTEASRIPFRHKKPQIQLTILIVFWTFDEQKNMCAMNSSALCPHKFPFIHASFFLISVTIRSLIFFIWFNYFWSEYAEQTAEENFPFQLPLSVLGTSGFPEETCMIVDYWNFWNLNQFTKFISMLLDIS